MKNDKDPTYYQNLFSQSVKLKIEPLVFSLWVKKVNHKMKRDDRYLFPTLLTFQGHILGLNSLH